jgi:hypothetical protein
MQQPIPPVLSAIVGDVAHNLRSALEAVAYHVARSDFDGKWPRTNSTRRTAAQTSRSFGSFHHASRTDR